MSRGIGFRELVVMLMYCLRLSLMFGQELSAVLSFESQNILALPSWFDLNDRHRYAFDEHHLYVVNPAGDSLLSLPLAGGNGLKIKVDKGRWKTVFTHDGGVVLANQLRYNDTRVQVYNWKEGQLEPGMQLRIKNDMNYLKLTGNELAYANFGNVARRNYLYRHELEKKLAYDPLFFVHMAPTQYVDFTDQQALFTCPDRYCLYLFDKTLRPTDTIMLPAGKTFMRDSAAIDRISATYVQHEPKKSLAAIQDYIQQNDFIWAGTFLNDSLILIRKSMALTYFFDVWQRSPEGWQLRYYNLSNPVCEADDLIGSDCLPFNVNMAFTKFRFIHNKLVVIKQDIPQQTLRMSYRDYLDAKEKHYAEKPPVYKVFIYALHW